MALHDVGRKGEGVAFTETDLHGRKEAVEGIRIGDVLHRVLYPQVHVKGFKNKKKNRTRE